MSLKSNQDKIAKLKHFTKMKESLSLEGKRKLLKALKLIKECGGTGNMGGNTDIINADNLIGENEYTARAKPKKESIATTYITTGNFKGYADQRRGTEILPKESDVINSGIVKYASITPDKFSIEYKNSDGLENNTDTIIKKVPEGREFCWMAFQKIKRAEDKGEPTEAPKNKEEADGEEPSLPLKERITESAMDDKLDALQAGLDIVGFDPEVIGVAADSTNALISLLRAYKDKCPEERKKHLLNAAISAVSAIPFADIVKFFKLKRMASKVGKTIKKEAATPKSYSIQEAIPTTPQSQSKPQPKASPSIPSKAPATTPTVPIKPEQPEEVTVEDTIRVTKSRTFNNEIEGAEVLADFIPALLQL